MNEDRPQTKIAFYRVRMMLAQMVLVPVAASSMLLLPLQFGSGIVAVLYGAVIWREQRLGVTSPISYALLFICLVVLGSQTLFKMEEYAPYVPSFFFSILFITGATLALLGRPATVFYGDAQSLIELHWRTSLAWVAVYALGLALGLILLASPQWYWLIPLVPLCGVAITMWLQYVDMGPAWRRSKSFQLGHYIFEQLPSTRDGLRAFYEHFIRESMTSIHQGIRPGQDSHKELVALKMELDTTAWPSTLFFAAYADGEIIGTISCVLKTPAVSLGFENRHTDRQFNLANLEKFGKILEIGRLSISPKHRFGQDVIQGLMRCVIEYALETDAIFLVAHSYVSGLPIFQKIGFQMVTDKVSYQVGLGTAGYPLVFNLARRVLCEPQESVSNRVSNILSPYLTERYFKRQTLYSLFTKQSAWTLCNDEIIQLILSASPFSSRPLET